MLAERKRFRIEGPGRPASPSAPAGPVTAPAFASPPSSAPRSAAPPAPTVPEPASPPIRQTSDAAIDAELAGMRAAIAAMRRDVASMQRTDAGPGGVHRAACELDAVFDATERATTTILGAVEEIEGAATLLRASGLDPGRSDYVGTILERVVLLYETCNFQDVTGQRIEKVVATLKFVEERLEAIAGRAGDEVLPAVAAPSTGPVLRGPALPTDEHNSQSDIDSYFG